MSRSTWRAASCASLAISRHTRYGPRDYAIVTLGLGCGLRLNEMAELKVDDIDFDQGVLTVRAETSKSGRERHVVLDAVAAAALDAYIKDWRKPATGDRHVFITNRDRPFKRESFCNVFDALRVAMAKAGVDGFMCQRLRDTWATERTPRRSQHL